MPTAVTGRGYQSPENGASRDGSLPRFIVGMTNSHVFTRTENPAFAMPHFGSLHGCEIAGSKSQSVLTVPVPTAIRVTVCFLLIGGGSCLAGCDQMGLEEEYRWTRPEPAAGRRSPTEFAVRIKVDKEKREITWMEKAWDKEGPIGETDIVTYDQCRIFDERNWECLPLLEMSPALQIQMTDGKLRQHYWGEDRNFTTHYRVLCLTF